MQKNSSYRWVILLLTFLPCFMASVCQFQATAYAGDLMEKYQLSEQAYSTIATAPMLVGVFISFLSGTLGDRFGVKKTVFAGLLITTIGAISRAFAPGYIVLLLVTVLMGVAGVMLNSNNAKLMSAWFSPQQLGIAIGVVVAAGNAGTVAAMAIGRSLSDNVSTAFLYGGAAFAVLTVLWLLFVRERGSEGASQPASQPKVRLGDVLKSANLWLAALGAALYMGVNMAASTLISPGLIARGVSDGAANLTVIVFSVVALLAAIFMPGIISKLPNTKVTCAVLAVAAGVTLYLGWAAGSDGMRNLLIAVSGVCLGGLLPTIMSMPAFLPEIGPAKIGAAGGLISTVMMAGAFLIPSYVITPIAGGINNTAFLVAAGCACLLALLFAILPNVSVRKG